MGCRENVYENYITFVFTGIAPARICKLYYSFNFLRATDKQPNKYI